MASGFDPPVFLFLACALMKEIGVLKNIYIKEYHSQGSGQGTYPGTRIIGGRVDITESPEVGGESCRICTSIITGGL